MSDFQMNALPWVMARVNSRLVLNIEETADALRLEVQTVYNAMGNGSFPIPMRKYGKRWFADARDVADYIDKMRAEMRSRRQTSSSQAGLPLDNSMDNIRKMTESSFVAVAAGLYQLSTDDERQALLARMKGSLKRGGT